MSEFIWNADRRLLVSFNNNIEINFGGTREDDPSRHKRYARYTQAGIVNCHFAYYYFNKLVDVTNRRGEHRPQAIAVRVIIPLSWARQSFEDYLTKKSAAVGSPARTASFLTMCQAGMLAYLKATTDRLGYQGDVQASFIDGVNFDEYNDLLQKSWDPEGPFRIDDERIFVHEARIFQLLSAKEENRRLRRSTSASGLRGLPFGPRGYEKRPPPYPGSVEHGIHIRTAHATLRSAIIIFAAGIASLLVVMNYLWPRLVGGGP